MIPMATQKPTKVSSPTTQKREPTAKSAQQTIVTPQPGKLRGGINHSIQRIGLETLQPATLSPQQISRAIEKVHPALVGGLAYQSQVEAMGISAEFLEAAGPAAVAFSQETQDDQLLVLVKTQALLAHARAARLATLAASETNVKSICMLNQACDGASRAVARLAAAMSEYRRPKTPNTVVSIDHSNLGHQQIIQESTNRSKHTEKNDVNQTRNNPAKALPPYQERAGVPTGVHRTNTALAKKFGAKDSGRKKPKRNERAKTR
jgi:hypothetical protein